MSTAKFLRFNSEKAARSFLREMEDVADDAMIRFHEEASDSRGAFMRGDTEGYYIHDYVVFGAIDILKSFGTGTLMDKTSRYLSDYMNSDLWNRLRTGYAVTGREAGPYTNIFGVTMESQGAYAGTDIEGYRYWPMRPTYSIQNAEKWLEQKNGWLDRKVREAVDRWVINEMPKFFEYR